MKRIQRNRDGDEKRMALTDTFVSRGKKILGDRLEGIYLHGSSVMGCFNPRKSDIDLLVVVKEAVPDAVKTAFMDMVVDLNGKAPAKGIEMDMVRTDVCRPFVYPTPFDLHFSIKHLDWYRTNSSDYIQKMNGENKDLAAYFEVIRRQGKCLCGSPIEQVFGEVSREAYLDSILCDVADAEEDIQTNTAYIVLNLLRVMAFIKEDAVLSKKEGGEWGIAKLPEAYRPLVRLALDEYVSDQKPDYTGEPLQDYARFMLGQIRGSVA